MLKAAKKLFQVYLISLVLFGSIGLIWWSQRPPIIRDMLWKQACCLFGADVAVRNSCEKFAEDFGVGKPSKDFVKRARQLGADEITVNGRTASTLGSLNFGDEHPDLKKFENEVKDMELEFNALSSGTAHIQVTVVPPFLRYNCEIEFKNGVVTHQRCWQLD